MTRHQMLPAVFVLWLAATPLLQPTASAQTDPRAEKITRLMQHLEKNDKFMGTVALSIDGKPIVDTQVGFFAEKTEAQRTPNSETQYRVGSITKMFTAVMIMQLVEEGKLTLETKLAKFYPDLSNADEITIVQLLRHRSGLGSITDDPTYRSWNTQAQTREKMLKRIGQQPTRFQPNERTEYSNTNFLLLGYIIEELSGQSYAETLKSRIADRIGLKRTAYATLADTDANVAVSFGWSDGQWMPRSETDPSIPHGAGSIMSTATDLVAFIENLFAGNLVKLSTLETMKTLNGRMGMGMMQMPFGPRKALAHNGGIDGFQSSLAYFPEDKVAIALIGNGYTYPMNEIMIGLLSIAFNREFELPSFEVSEVDPETLKRYEGVYGSPAIPLKITVTVKDGSLMAQATGQDEFPLTAISDVEFKFDAAGIVMGFSESKAGSGFDSLRLKQGGQDIPFKKVD